MVVAGEEGGGWGLLWPASMESHLTRSYKSSLSTKALSWAGLAPLSDL